MGGSSFQTSVFSDVSRVGAAAAAVFRENSRSADQPAVSCEPSVEGNSLKDIEQHEQTTQSVLMEDTVQLEEKEEHRQLVSGDMIRLSELKKAFRVGEFNGWTHMEVEALIRKVTTTDSVADPTPNSVDRAALKQ